MSAKEQGTMWPQDTTGNPCVGLADDGGLSITVNGIRINKTMQQWHALAADADAMRDVLVKILADVYWRDRDGGYPPEFWDAITAAEKLVAPTAASERPSYGQSAMHWGTSNPEGSQALPQITVAQPYDKALFRGGARGVPVIRHELLGLASGNTPEEARANLRQLMSKREPEVPYTPFTFEVRDATGNLGAAGCAACGKVIVHPENTCNCKRKDA